MAKPIQPEMSQLNEQLAELDARLAAVETRVANIEATVADHASRVANNEAQVAEHAGRLADHAVRIAALEAQPAPNPEPDPQPTPDPIGDEVVAVQLNASTTAGYLTFGHVFAEGDLAVGTGIAAVIGADTVPVQVDVKATHADGSVRHAILTMFVPALAVDTEVSLVRAMADTRAPLDAGFILAGYDLTLNLNVAQPDSSVVSHSVTPDLSSVDYWLSGPDVVEFRVAAVIDPLLRARFDVRVYADGTIRTDVSVYNDSIYFSGTVYPTTVVYDVEIVQGGAVQYTKLGVRHHRNSNWHKEIWAGAGPSNAHLRYDQTYLVATKAIPGMDYSLGVPEQALINSHAEMQASNTDILGDSLVTKRFASGPEGAPLTPWASQYFVSQDPRAKEVMLAQADVSGSITWHYYDVTVGEWVDIDTHPLVRAGSKGVGAEHGDDALQGWDLDDGGWQPETAHYQTLTFLPYLITGSRYYMEELAAASTFCLLIYTWGREQDQGLTRNQQVRGRGWTMMALGEAAYLLPDGHALKGHFKAKLLNNIADLTTEYVVNRTMAAAGDLEGYIVTHNPGSQASTWQQDFVCVALALCAQRGFAEAVEILSWAEGYTAGRYTNEDIGADPIYGSSYWLYVKDPVTLEFITTWPVCFETTVTQGGLNSNQLLGYPANSVSYVLKARAALAGHITVNGSADAIAAYGAIEELSAGYGFWDPGSNSSVYSNPQWLIAPVMPDGRHMTKVPVTERFGKVI